MLPIRRKSSKIVERLKKMGYRFCMDQIVDLDFDAEALAELGFHFVKVEAGRSCRRKGAMTTGEAADRVKGLKRRLDVASVDLIVEKIETEQMLVELLDYDIDFGQGYLFGEPRLSQDPPSAHSLQGSTRDDPHPARHARCRGALRRVRPRPVGRGA